MDNIKEDELKALIRQSPGPCVSIYMPTHRAGMEIQQDPIRLKNLIRDAEEKLVSGGHRRPDALEILTPARDLLNDTAFWRHQADGLALFLSREFFRNYRLPLNLQELVMIDGSFYLKPLLSMLGDDGGFFVLALSQSDLRLFECTRHSIREVELEDVPRSLDEALRFDDPEKQLQYHTASRGGRRDGYLMFHGHSGSEPKKDILRYLLLVNDGLHKYLNNRNEPLVLAGVDYLLPIFREATTYGGLVEEAIMGNPEGFDEQELHRQAWSIVEPIFRKTRDEALARYVELAGTGLAGADPEAVLGPAFFGRVDTLFVARGLQRWGTFDSETGLVSLHEAPQPGDRDLLDFAALHTFMNRGKVYVLEPEMIPGGKTLAAIFRY